MKNCKNCGTVFEEPKYCSDKCEQESNMKYRELEVRELPKLTKLEAPEDMNCKMCNCDIQDGGTVWRFADYSVTPLDISFVCCNCSKLT